MSTLGIRLFGDFQLSYGGEPVTTVHQPRLQSFLAYLLLHRDAPLSRQQIAFQFWPDVPEAQARNNLRQTVHHLRQRLPNVDQFLVVDGSAVRWRHDAPFSLDVAEFQYAMTSADSAGRIGAVAVRHAALKKAVDLYRGDLLPTCYDDWIAEERDRLQRQWLHALQRLVAVLEQQHEYAAAIDFTHRLVRQDPLNEDAYLSLIRLSALTGDRAGALRVYRECLAVFQSELGVEPGPAIREAYDRLLRPHAWAPIMTTRRPKQTVAAPLIGRQRAWQQLQTTWSRAADGEALFGLVTGEAGIGKSRLAEEMFLWVEGQGISAARTRAYASEGRMSYAPVTEWLRSDALRPAIAQLDRVWLGEIARLLPELVDHHLDSPAIQPLTEHWQRNRFFEALARAMLVARRPLLLVIDDLQWCDQESLEWLHFLLRFDPRARLLVVGTVRQEEVTHDHPLASLMQNLRIEDKLVEIQLDRLDAAETAALAAHIVGQELDLPHVTHLYRETEGNPLFVAETLRAGFDAMPTYSPLGPADGETHRLPPRVHAVIAARLSLLSKPAHELVLVAAVIGRAFTLAVLSAASSVDEDQLVHGVDELWQRRIVREQGLDAYDFSHDKLREVAYSSLSAAYRHLLHRRVAQALERVYASNLDPVSAQIAAHYERAGMPELALLYYRRAATVAQQVYATAEAVNLLHSALALLRSLPASPAVDEQELDLQMALGAAMVAARGYGAADVLAVYSRAQVLCERLHRPPSPPILRALAIASITGGQFDRGLVLGERLLELAEQGKDRVLIVEAHYVLGVTHFWQGSFQWARTHLEWAIGQYAPQQVQTHIRLYSQDPRVICLCRLAFDLWCLGYADQAFHASQQALALAHELGHPFSLGYVMYWDALLSCHVREAEVVQEKTQMLIGYSQEYQLGFWSAPATFLNKWAIAQLRAADPGIAAMEESIQVFKAGSAQFLQPYLMALLAGLEAQRSDLLRAMQLIDEALAGINTTGERWCEAEVYRHQGQVWVLRGDTDAAEASFQRALDSARWQDAKAFELRAAVSLARLWLQQGRRDAARSLLSEVYGWFTEGFHTPDLREARRMLDGLA